MLHPETQAGGIFCDFEAILRPKNGLFCRKEIQI